jgi:hypothetical protein
VATEKWKAAVNNRDLYDPEGHYFGDDDVISHESPRENEVVTEESHD